MTTTREGLEARLARADRVVTILRRALSSLPCCIQDMMDHEDYEEYARYMGYDHAEDDGSAVEDIGYDNAEGVG